jgi:hypothetical protein
MKLRKIPRGTFWLGGLAAVALAVPLLSLGIFGLTQRLHWGPLVAPLDEIFWISLIFSGVPAFLVGGGVARTVAHRIAERDDMTLGKALGLGSITMGVGGIGLAILCAVALGALPADPRVWAPIGGVGLLAGGLTGLALSVLAALRQRRHHPEVAT